MIDTLFLYHKDCADGFGAAFSAWLFHHKRLNFAPDNARREFLPVAHGEPLPAQVTDQDWHDIVLLDFCYPIRELRCLQQNCRSLVIIDHHKSTQHILEEFSAYERWSDQVVWELNNSGAVLAWQHFHNSHQCPRLLRYIEDRDLWRWNLWNSREVNAAIWSYERDFETWLRLSVRVNSDSGLESMSQEGEAILRYQNNIVGQHVANAVLAPFLAYPNIPIVNATTLQSEIGEALCFKYPEAPFSVTMRKLVNGKVSYSLRSRGEFDCGDLARQYGGGGHPGAAGFTI